MNNPRSSSNVQTEHTQGSANLYRYRLLESENTFRLLKLHAGQENKIICSIQHHDLSSTACPSYRAISYTWGKDADRHQIFLSDNTIIKVRENLMNALRSVRDKEDDCWLWIDAICIDQRSDVERNHQVKLMSQIYSNANIVLVWLQSAGELANVARAFRFVHAAATYDSSEHSVYNYSKAHPDESRRNWRSLQNLARLRYWRRKWIIQELISARTAVLHVPNATCSMADIETFFSQLHRHKDVDAYKRSIITNRDIWNIIVNSSMSLLALQRSEARAEPRPQLLHELIERYASNECSLPCDHVYALYNLAGQQRRHLSIDYAASAVKRLAAVLQFAHTHEGLQPSRTLEFANMLMKLFVITEEDVRRGREFSENLDLTAFATLLGRAELLPESETSIALRKEVKTLPAMPSFSIDSSRENWVLTKSDGVRQADGVGRQDMSYFKISDSDFHGLAACRVQQGDMIHHLPGTQLVFAIRESRDERHIVVGRAYLYSAAADSEQLEPWLEKFSDFQGARRGQDIVMNLATLLEFSKSLTLGEKHMEQQPRKRSNTGAHMGVIGALWSRNWTSKAVVAAAVFQVLLLLAILLSRVVK